MPNDKYTKPTDKRFTLRLDGGLFETIKWCAEKHKRSIAKEIEFAIEFYLDDLAMLGKLHDEDDDLQSTIKKL